VQIGWSPALNLAPRNHRGDHLHGERDDDTARGPVPLKKL
jgi:hypothetical protein